MNKIIYLFLFLLIAVSCRNKNSDSGNSRAERKIIRQAIDAAEDYASGELKNPSRQVTDADIIVLSDSLNRFLIDPSKIITGDFAGDSLPDAVIPVYLFREQALDQTITLFLVNIEGKLMTVRALEDDMKVISVKDRLIYIEVPVKNLTTTNPECLGCKEVREFVFEGDSLRRYFSATDTIR